MNRIYQEETILQFYDPDNNIQTAQLLNWWNDLVLLDELHKVLLPCVHPLSHFISYFNRTRLVYVTDPNERIHFAAWGEPVSHNVIFLSLWIAPHLRHTKQGVQIVLDFYTQLFKLFQVVLGITKQHHLIRTHKKFGYELISHIPHGWGGAEDAWLVQLTKENFHKATQT